MEDQEIRDVLVTVLDALQQQSLYLHRQHRWIIALSETVRKNPQLAADLEQHPFYDQGPAPYLRSIDGTLQTLASLIEKLRVRP